MKKSIFVVLFSALLLSFNSCKDYMDINYDPNSPAEEQMTSDMLVPAVEMNIATAYGCRLHILGAYNVQYYAQQFGTPNYVSYSQFEVSPGNGSGVYTQLFQRALSNLNIVKNKAIAKGDKGVLLQVATLRAFSYQLLVDAFGEVPYTEAFDVANMAPKYDEGQVIYEGLIKEIDEALANVSASDAVSTSFIIPSKSTADWIKFAKAQKLKLLGRMSNVKDVTTEIQAIIDENDLPAQDVQIAGCWANATGSANPFYSEERATWGRVTHNIIANVALVNTLKTDTYTDPRLAAWIKTNKAGEFQGSISGTNLSTVEDKYKSTDVWCELVLNYNQPVILISRAEIDFFIAEHYARKADAAKASAAYAAAIEASFKTAGVDGAAAHVAKFPYDQTNWKQSIGIEKWKALAGINGFEGYTEARRLKYPEFGIAKGSDMYSGSGALDLSKYEPNKLYTPFKVFNLVGDNKLLARFPYPESSTARNSKAPAFTDDMYVKPIFWGK